MEEHPVSQPITAIRAPDTGGHESWYVVGEGSTVTRIEACQKSGLHANIAYVRIWEGEHCVAEFCQHDLLGTYFGKAAA